MKYPKKPSKKDILKAEKFEKLADEIDISSIPSPFSAYMYRSWAKSLREGTEPVAFA